MNLSELGEDASLQTVATKGKSEEVQNNRNEDAEIIVFYSRKKIDHQSLPLNKIIEVDLYAYDPDEFAVRYKPSENDEWFYFTLRDRKYGMGNSFMDEAFKNGFKTNWIMHAFKVAKPPKPPRRSGVNDMRLDDYVLCGVYREDEMIYKRSRHESRLDESDPSSSKILRLDLFNPNPSEPQPRTEIFQSPQEHDHFALQSNTQFPILDPSVFIKIEMTQTEMADVHCSNCDGHVGCKIV
ncbi:hypothetical protein PVL29_002454 [Vitis rotundifolia]|uniref:NAC domain-containing protein n=1 Tax=Vitis rotundifolia TaxID=103349 RepID=A0AA39E842_VITRO|nr:hypothetical protein PVL29_002454 [Vitis rotundifolia]